MNKNIESPIQSSFLALPSSTNINEAINKMMEVQTSCILIIDNEKLIGIFTERDVVKIKVNVNLSYQSTLNEVMTTNVITVNVSQAKDLLSLSKLFKVHKVHHLPVLNENNSVIGVITPQSIRNIFRPEYLLRYIKVQEVISQKNIQDFPNTSILTLAQNMIAHEVSCAIILDPLTFFPIGIITERDLVQFHNLDLDFSTTLAQDVMSSPLYTVLPTESVWNVNQNMNQLKVRRLVVTNSNNELLGIVTQKDMLKILNPNEMYHVMQHMQEIINQQTYLLNQLNARLKKENLYLENISIIDELTQVFNRRKLNEFFDFEWQLLEELKQPLSLIMCDVDYFKLYNDQYGHLSGDKCLIEIAQILKKVTRKNSDIVIRYGGEEFLIILPNVDTINAKRIAKTILKKVENLKIPHSLSKTSKFVTVSLGVITTNYSQTESPKTLLEKGDQLLYQSKKSGRNTYTIKDLSV